MTAKQVCCSSLVGLAVLMIVGPRLDQAGQESAWFIAVLLVVVGGVSATAWNFGDLR